MIHRIEIYLDEVLRYADLPTAEAVKARNELADHLLSRVAELTKDGASQDDAAFRAIYEHGKAVDVGYGLRPPYPWIDVRLRGTARGIFAVGPKAVGVFACGLVSTGIVSCGLISFGVLSVGLFTFALFLGLGMVSVGSVALGVNALGLIAVGLTSAGVLCGGHICIGLWALQGQNALTYYDERSVPDWLNQWSFFLSWNGLETIVGLAPFVVVLALTFLVAMSIWVRESSRLQTARPSITQ